MLLSCIAAEWLKLRRSGLWLVLAALPLFSLLIGCANYYFNRTVLTNGWYSLWTQVSLFYGEFFLPLLIAICCAYLCRLEHMNRNWNRMLTVPVSIAVLFMAKLVVISLLAAAVQALMALLYLAAGLAFGLSLPPPPELFGWIMRGWMASVVIGAAQLMLSLRIRSFAVPVGIALCAVLAGLGFYIAKVGLLFPYSLLTIGMGVLNQQSLSMAELSGFTVMAILFTLLFSFLAIRRLKQTDAI